MSAGDQQVLASIHGTWVLKHSRHEGMWTYADGSSGRDHDGDARPLVAIDPEDREQVERLHRLRDAAPGLGVERTQAALREYADPTRLKPTEPLGLGAVVVDGTCTTWVRAEVGECAWLPVGLVGPFKCWSEIDAAHVLSEGLHA